MRQVDIQARTVEEAVNLALEQLGRSRDQVKVEVLATDPGGEEVLVRVIAVLALQAVGFAAIICASADAGFVAAAEAYGLPVLSSPAAVAAITPGGVLRLDLAGGRITDRASGESYTVPPCAPTLVNMVRRAQLLSRMRRVVEEEGFDG